MMKLTTLTPVKLLMKRRMSQETMMPTRPRMALPRVEEAWATFFSSPLEKRYEKPPEINIKRKTRPAITVMI